MANSQPWRLHIVKSRRLPDARPDTSDVSVQPDETGISTSPETESLKARPRAKKGFSSITTYLNAHHRVSTPNGHEKASLPCLDWSNLECEDEACKADLESMCNAIRQQLLKNPSKALPASFNGAILHIIEACGPLLTQRKDTREKTDEQAVPEPEEVTKSHDRSHRRSVKDHLSTIAMVNQQPHLAGSGASREGIPSQMTGGMPSGTDQDSTSSPVTVPRKRKSIQDSQGAEYLAGLERNSGDLRNLRPKLSEPSLSTYGPLNIRQDTANTLKQTGEPQPMTRPATIKKRDHSRGFSFVPGDDDVRRLYQPYQLGGGTAKDLTKRLKDASDPIQSFDHVQRTKEGYSESAVPKQSETLRTTLTTTTPAPCVDISRNNSLTTTEHEISHSSASSLTNSTAGHAPSDAHRRSTNRGFAIAAARAAENSSSSNKSTS